MQRRIAKVVCRHEPIRSNLLLDADVPLMDVWGLELLRKLKDLLRIGERQIRIHDEWKRTASGKASPWFLKTARRTGDDDIPCPGRSLFDGVVMKEVPVVEEVSVCGAHRQAAITGGIPCESQPRREPPLQPGRTGECIRGSSWVAWK